LPHRGGQAREGAAEARRFPRRGGGAVSLTEQNERLLDLVEHLIIKSIEVHCPENKHPTDWDIRGLEESYKRVFGLKATTKSGDPQELASRLYKDAESVLEKKEKDFGPEHFLRAFRTIYLREIDRQWLEHLTTMEQLRDGIGLRAWGQRDPKKEYKKEGYDIFVAMTESCKEEVCKQMFAIKVVREDDIRRIEEDRRREADRQLGRLRPQHPGSINIQEAPAQQQVGGRPVRPQAALSPAQAAALAAAARTRQALAASHGAPSSPPAASAPSPAPAASPAMSAAQIAALQAAAARAAALRSQAQPAAAPAPVPAPVSAPDDDGDDEPALQAEASRQAAETVRRDKPKVGRNDPCHCGSGKKYKNCHMREDQAGGGAI
jgi:preprotein translocase subunit SecA